MYELDKTGLLKNRQQALTNHWFWIDEYNDVCDRYLQILNQKWFTQEEYSFYKSLLHRLEVTYVNEVDSLVELHEYVKKQAKIITKTN